MRMRRAGSVALVLVALAASAAAQVPFDEAIGGLSSPDVKVRLHSATLLKESRYVESAIPLARLIADVNNDVQIEAIDAELNIFLAEPVGARRVGIVVIEDRAKVAGEAAFDAGPLALGAKPVPLAVLLALRIAAQDDSPRVRLDALYAFGTLAAQLTGKARRDLQAASVADLASMLTLPDPPLRMAAVRVIGRLYARRRGDPPVDRKLGDLVIAAVNEPVPAMKLAAMDALGDIGEARAVDGLAQLFDFYGKGELAEAALGALARVGARSSAPLLLKQLGSRSPVMRTLAIDGLARTGDATQMAAIQSALDHERDARVLLAGNFAAAMLSSGSIEQIVDALNRPKSHDAARQYLVEIAPGRVSRMARYAQDPEARMRADVADIVGLAADPEGVAVVTPLLKDDDPQVALAAARAMARLNGA